MNKYKLNDTEIQEFQDILQEILDTEGTFSKKDIVPSLFALLGCIFEDFRHYGVLEWIYIALLSGAFLWFLF